MLPYTRPVVRLLPILLLGACQSPTLPQVPSARAVPLSAFTTLENPGGWRGALACTFLDPQGRLLRGPPAILRVDAERMQLGELSIPLDGAGGLGEQGLTRLVPLLEWRQAWFDGLEDGAPDCVDDPYPRLLIEAHPEVPLSTLAALPQVLWGVELWLAVDAEARHAPGLPPEPVCRQVKVLRLEPDGALRVGKATRGGDGPWSTWDERRLPPGRGGPDLQAALAELTRDPWAHVHAPILDVRDRALGDVVSLLALLDAQDRVTPGLLGYEDIKASTPSGDGPLRAALPLGLGGWPGECLFAEADPTCVGVDGALHLEDADDCRYGPELALFALTRPEETRHVAIDGAGALHFPEGAPAGEGWSLTFVEGNEARTEEVKRELKDRGLTLLDP